MIKYHHIIDKLYNLINNENIMMNNINDDSLKTIKMLLLITKRKNYYTKIRGVT